MNAYPTHNSFIICKIDICVFNIDRSSIRLCEKVDGILTKLATHVLKAAHKELVIKKYFRVNYMQVIINPYSLIMGMFLRKHIFALWTLGLCRSSEISIIRSFSTHNQVIDRHKPFIDIFDKLSIIFYLQKGMKLEEI